MNKDSILFTPVKVGSITIKNRFMRSPCYMHNSDNGGFPKENLLKYYRDMADGQVGLIIPGYFAISQAGKTNPGQAEITVNYIHSKGSKILAQACDGGAVNDNFDITRERPRGPSAYAPGSREMTKMEISEVIQNFHDAAIRLQKAGFDGIEIHAAHGYLVSQFLSPYSNHRTDSYGGSPENRRRLLKEIVDSIRSDCGKEFVIAAKVNGTDCLKGGFGPSDCAELVKALPQIDLFEVSNAFQGMRMEDFLGRPDSTVAETKVVRESNPTAKLACVRGHRRFKEIEKVVSAGIADLVSFGRPSIADPFFVQHFLEGAKRTVCVSCNKCSLYCRKRPVRCYYLYPETKEEISE